jgi:hypothetical protein
MSQPSENSGLQSWHERFAMSCNNRAWELSAQPRTALQDREMLDAAHASAWHWAQIGTELNRMRATMLLAEVHALLGSGPAAFSFAQEMRNYFLSRDTADWELAFTHAIYAHAAYADGRLAEHRSAYEEATAALQAIKDEEDRRIVLDTFNQVPPA